MTEDRERIDEITKEIKEEVIVTEDAQLMSREEGIVKKIEVEPKEISAEELVEKPGREKRFEDEIHDRKKRIILFFKKKSLWVIGVLIIALILGIYLRSLPMTVHGGNPGLWDITTNTWTLGPDLDPWLFLRQAKILVEEGSLPKIDIMRNVPLGFDNSIETKLLPGMIVWTYGFLNLFSEASVEYAAVIFPVIMFALTILAFFLFVREIFKGENKTRANIIALISTFFMIVIPAFLSRTLAGIPEKESAGFFFMFLALFLFLKAWRAENLKKAVMFGVLSGIATALMGLVWGGVVYTFIAIALATLIAFVLNKVHKKEFFVYTSWLIVSSSILILFYAKYNLKELIGSVNTMLAFFVFFTMLIHFGLWHTKMRKNKILIKYNLPKNILSLIISIIIGFIIISIIFGSMFIFEKMGAVIGKLINPTTGRWGITVAENRQPYFTEWGASFGPHLKGIPILFWMFFAGSVVLFKKMLDKIKNKDAWVLTGLYVLFFIGLVFSRYSGASTLNGENFISKLFYFGSGLLFVGFLIYYYIKYSREGLEGFKKISFGLLFLFSLFVLCLVTVRGAVRLVMVLAPIAPVFLGFLIVESTDWFRKSKNETEKIIFGMVVILILILSLFTFWNFYRATKAQSYAMVPSYYNQQWQKAMQWVREETPENAVFAHWWDYGYWVQSIGDRATVLDGGNAIVWWNYLMGRLVLTGDNQADALEYLYTHNATHLLIDSTDIGKYTAFSSIGSDEDYDRYAWIPTFLIDNKQTTETRNGVMEVYSGGTALDEDIIYDNNGSQVFLPAHKAGLAGVVIEAVENNETAMFKQPVGVFVYQGKQIKIPLRYVYYNNQWFDFKGGLEACAYLIQKLNQNTQGINIDNSGALIYISPRVLRGYLAQKYLLNDPFDKFPNFDLVYREPNLIVDDLRRQGLNLGEFIYFNGLQGPIKIWKINYTGNEKINEEHLLVRPPEYITWRF